VDPVDTNLLPVDSLWDTVNGSPTLGSCLIQTRVVASAIASVDHQSALVLRTGSSLSITAHPTTVAKDSIKGGVAILARAYVPLGVRACNVGAGSVVSGAASILHEVAEALATSAKILARAYSKTIAKSSIKGGISVSAIAYVPLGIRICHISLGSSVLDAARVQHRAMDVVVLSGRVTAGTKIQKLSTVGIAATLSARLIGMNLARGGMTARPGSQILARGVRNMHINAVLRATASVVPRAQASMEAQVHVEAKALESPGLRASAAEFANPSVLYSGHTNIPAAMGLLVGAQRTVRAQASVRPSTLLSASGERNSLGGIQSTIKSLNPTSKISPIGPTSNILVIPS
jgi:hypothetical protein